MATTSFIKKDCLVLDSTVRFMKHLSRITKRSDTQWKWFQRWSSNNRCLIRRCCKKKLKCSRNFVMRISCAYMKSLSHLIIFISSWITATVVIYLSILIPNRKRNYLKVRLWSFSSSILLDTNIFMNRKLYTGISSQRI